MELVINFLPLIVAGVGLLICTAVMIIMDKVFDCESEIIATVQILLLALVITVTVGTSKYRDIHISQNNNNSYNDIDNLAHNGYTVYIDGSAVDMDKIIISDYPNDKIYVNDELKEIYISSSN